MKQIAPTSAPFRFIEIKLYSYERTRLVWFSSYDVSLSGISHLKSFGFQSSHVNKQHKNPWILKSSRVAYENPWLRVEHHEVINPSGGDGIYGKVHFKNQAIGIIPLDEDGNTYLVGQWRYPLEEYHWEIPEGGCPLGTDSLATARRELKEETGLVADKWTKLLDFHLSNSVTDEYGVAYIARELRQEDAEPEPTEDLMIRKLPLTEAIKMVMNGTIKDALSIMALQRVALLRLHQV